MEISNRFLEVLKSIDYHVGHLSRDLFANEEQLPELEPIFTWFINNVTPKSNCVTPKELVLFSSISSKYDCSSTETLSSAINKYYDKSTKSSNVCSSDLEMLEKQILKSQQELNDLKSLGTLYENKKQSLDDEIVKLKDKENNVSKICFKAENDFNTVIKTFIKEVETFGTNIHKIHNNVTNSMTNGDECLTKLVSKNIINLINLWRQQILKMVDVWFGEENIPPDDDTLSKKIIFLCILSKSVADLRMADNNAKCYATKLNIAINNTLNIIHYYEQNIHSEGLDITNYLKNQVQPQTIPINNEHNAEYEELKSCISSVLNAIAEKKLSDLEAIDSRITSVQDFMEYYIMMCDVLWCLMKTDCSMMNLKCELVNHCSDFLAIMLNDITQAEQWASNHVQKTPPINEEKGGISFNAVAKFDWYKHYTKIYDDNNEIEKLLKMTREWKSKYHYSRNECHQLTTLQKKLIELNNMLNDLTKKYSN